MSFIAIKPKLLATPAVFLGLSLLLLAAGCGRPDQVNVQLRRERQQLEQQLEELQALRAADRARITTLEQRAGTLPTLPNERLERMFTTHDITLGRLTGGEHLDPRQPGHEAVKVYLTPLDEGRRPLPATGTAVIELFDLESDPPVRVQRWQLDAAALKEVWHSFGPLNAFIMTLPLDQPPPREQLTLRVAFQDELTGRSFRAQRPVSLELPDRPSPDQPATLSPQAAQPGTAGGQAGDGQ